MNLLAYDALGCTRQLKKWLFSLPPGNTTNGQILAIKYEDLWDPETIQAIRRFLNLKKLQLPLRKDRGYDLESIGDLERAFRIAYNQGTPDDPKYAAYDEARALWEKAPPLQYFNLPR